MTIEQRTRVLADRIAFVAFGENRREQRDRTPARRSGAFEQPCDGGPHGCRVSAAADRFAECDAAFA